MIFVTYYDSRHADAAKAELQDSLIHDRQIDVHYSLPKEDEGKAESDLNKGVLFVTFSGVSKPLDNEEIKSLFSTWGDIKEVRDCSTPHQKFIECYDVRASAKIFEERQDFQWGDCTLSIQYAKHQRPRERSEYQGGREPGYNNPGRSNFGTGSGSNFVGNNSHSGNNFNTGRNNMDNRSNLGRGGNSGRGGRGSSMRSSFASRSNTNASQGPMFNNNFSPNTFGGGYGNPNLLGQLAQQLLQQPAPQAQAYNQGDVTQQLMAYLALQKQMNFLGNTQ